MSTTIKYFAFAHLPAKLQMVSKPIGELAQQLEALLPEGPEKSAGMRKLLEAKDCFVRSAMDAPDLIDTSAIRSTRPVCFSGVDPLALTRGASKPMLADSWRFGFTEVGGVLHFGHLDFGPLVAFEAVHQTGPAASSSEAVLRKALEGLVGTGDVVELQGIRATLEALPEADGDRAITISAIDALLSTIRM